jgi:hypothetical protein
LWYNEDVTQSFLSSFPQEPVLPGTGSYLFGAYKQS